MKPKVYLAGPWNEYEHKWKDSFRSLLNVEIYDPELHSDQNGDYFADDLAAVRAADYLVAYPGTTPAEAMWLEVGYFYAQKMNGKTGRCSQLIIVWPENRKPVWSIEFLKQAGRVVESLEQAVDLLKK